MPGRPIDELTAQGLRGYRVFWAIILEQGRGGNPFTVADVHGKTNAALDTVRGYMASLARAGYLKLVEQREREGGRPAANVYRLLKTPQDAPRLRRDGTPVEMGAAREQMWRTIHMLGKFTVRDLVVAASTERTPIKESDAKDYLRYLRAAGYLASQRQALPGGPALYRLLPGRYTGPKPPMVQRTRQVFDPNLGKVVWSQMEGRS